MVAIEAIRKSNARIAELPAGLVALFLGGTSGIGQSALIQFATYAIQPRIYIAARRASATTGLLEELHEKNPGGTYTVIEKDVSLICETNDVVEFVKARETKLDLLFESVGFISFSGRQETAEGLEPSMTTRYYSRLRAAQGLLPLLNAAASPRVVSILAGGHEAKMNEEDLITLTFASLATSLSSAQRSTRLLCLHLPMSIWPGRTRVSALYTPSRALWRRLSSPGDPLGSCFY
jgi:NAD(P)-dependent dehydrogenase (short-subunit alcohol dehydrogenase family)